MQSELQQLVCGRMVCQCLGVTTQQALAVRPLFILSAAERF